MEATTETGIDAAAEKGTQGHIGDHADAHGFVKQIAEGLASLGSGHAFRRSSEAGGGSFQ